MGNWGDSVLFPLRYHPTEQRRYPYSSLLSSLMTTQGTYGAITTRHPGFCYRTMAFLLIHPTHGSDIVGVVPLRRVIGWSPDNIGS